MDTFSHAVFSVAYLKQLCAISFCFFFTSIDKYISNDSQLVSNKRVVCCEFDHVQLDDFHSTTKIASK